MWKLWKYVRKKWKEMKLFRCNTQHTISFVLKVLRIFITKYAFIVPSCNVCTSAIRYINIVSFNWMNWKKNKNIVNDTIKRTKQNISFEMKTFHVRIATISKVEKHFILSLVIDRWMMVLLVCQRQRQIEKWNKFLKNQWPDLNKIKFQLRLFKKQKNKIFFELWIILITAFWLSYRNYIKFNSVWMVFVVPIWNCINAYNGHCLFWNVHHCPEWLNSPKFIHIRRLPETPILCSLSIMFWLIGLSVDSLTDDFTIKCASNKIIR